MPKLSALGSFIYRYRRLDAPSNKAINRIRVDEWNSNFQLAQIEYQGLVANIAIEGSDTVSKSKY